MPLAQALVDVGLVHAKVAVGVQDADALGTVVAFKLVDFLQVHVEQSRRETFLESDEFERDITSRRAGQSAVPELAKFQVVAPLETFHEVEYLRQRLRRIAEEPDAVLNFENVQRRAGGDEPVARGLHGVQADVAGDETAAGLVGDSCRRAAAAEEVGDDHALVRRRIDDPLEQRFGLLGRVVVAFLGLRIHGINVRPQAMDAPFPATHRDTALLRAFPFP